MDTFVRWSNKRAIFQSAGSLPNLGALPQRRIFATSPETRAISATLERGSIPLNRLRSWLLAATFSLGFASCFLNPGPDLPRSEPASGDGGTTGDSGGSGGRAGTSASGSGGTATGGSAPLGGTAGTSAGGTTSIDAGPDAPDDDAGPGNGGAGGEDAEDAGPDADDAGG